MKERGKGSRIDSIHREKRRAGIKEAAERRRARTLFRVFVGLSQCSLSASPSPPPLLLSRCSFVRVASCARVPEARWCLRVSLAVPCRPLLPPLHLGSYFPVHAHTAPPGAAPSHTMSSASASPRTRRSAARLARPSSGASIVLVVALASLVAVALLSSMAHASSGADEVRLLRHWFHEAAEQVRWVVAKQRETTQRLGAAYQQLSGLLLHEVAAGFCLPVGSMPDPAATTSFFIRVDIELLAPPRPDDVLLLDYDYNGPGVDYVLELADHDTRFPLEIEPDDVLPLPNPRSKRYLRPTKLAITPHDDAGLEATTVAVAAADSGTDAVAPSASEPEPMGAIDSNSTLAVTPPPPPPLDEIQVPAALGDPSVAPPSNDAVPQPAAVNDDHSPVDTGLPAADDAGDAGGPSATTSTGAAIADDSTEAATIGEADNSRRITLVLHAVRDPIKDPRCRCGWNMADLEDGLFSGVIFSNVSIGEITFAIAAVSFQSVKIDRT